jgi:hypothetical protein
MRVPLSRGEAMLLLILSAMIITYPEVGYLPIEEHTEAFNDDLLSFLAEVYGEQNG